MRLLSLRCFTAVRNFDLALWLSKRLRHKISHHGVAIAYVEELAGAHVGLLLIFRWHLLKQRLAALGVERNLLGLHICLLARWLIVQVKAHATSGGEAGRDHGFLFVFVILLSG